VIEFIIPGRGAYKLEHLVMDVNGTLAIDGHLMDGVAGKVASLRNGLTIHLLTADTHGKQTVIDQQLGLIAVRIARAESHCKKRNMSAGWAVTR
jgi:soluble P-type ATPase